MVKPLRIIIYLTVATQRHSKSEFSASNKLAIATEDSVLLSRMSGIIFQLSSNVIEAASLSNFIADYGNNE
jgi:hypothetical protein